MQFLGQINRRKIYYIQIRNNSDWKRSIPNKDWLAFTIANEEDIELIPPVIKVCIDKNVSYSCSVGLISGLTEDFFDEEISWRNVDVEENQGMYSEQLLLTTSHDNFDEGFWFASTTANDDRYLIDKIVCIDLTKRKVRNQLIKLIEQINRGWLP